MRRFTRLCVFSFCFCLMFLMFVVFWRLVPVVSGVSDFSYR